MIKILKKMQRLDLIRYVYFNDVHILWNTSMTKGVSRGQLVSMWVDKVNENNEKLGEVKWSKEKKISKKSRKIKIKLRMS